MNTVRARSIAGLVMMMSVTSHVAASERVDAALALPFASEALATGFRSELPETERLAGLAQVWSEAKYNFANFDLAPDVDWDARHLEFIPKVQAATRTEDYYRVLQAFVAALRDGHTYIRPPEELFAHFYSRPPVYTRLVDGRVIVYLVDSRRLRDAGLVDGVEILAIDGEPVHDYAARAVRPFQSASTSQDLEVRTYNQSLLRGPADLPVTLTVEDASGRRSEHRVPRSGYAKEDRVHPAPEWFSWRMLDGGIALLDVRSFNDAAVVEQFLEALPELREARGWVFDVRLNGGGNSGHGWSMLAHLVSEPLALSAWRTRIYRPTFRAWQRETAWAWETSEHGSRPPADGDPYDGPVVVLSSARTYSAAEDFLVAFRQAGRGPIIGQASGGSTGQPLHVALPGGGRVSICTKRDTFADGSDFVGVGVRPDIEVAPTVSDLRQGRDPVLERAVAEIERLLSERAPARRNVAGRRVR